MRLIPESGMRKIEAAAHWRRCTLQDTAVVGDLVMLARQDPVTPPPDASGDFTGGYAGMAFDRTCRLFHARPEDAALEYVLWGQTTALGVHDDSPHPFEIAPDPDAASPGAMPKRPLALACDASDFLYVADPDDSAVWLVDIWQQQIAKRIPFPEKPLDLAGDGDVVIVLLADGSTWQLSPCNVPERTPWPAVAGAERLAIDLSRKGNPAAWVMVKSGHFDATIMPLTFAGSLATPFCTDLVIETPASADADIVLVLAQRPGEEFRRLQMDGIAPTSLQGLVAPHYDGRGIALAPDGRVAFWTAQGLRHAAPARARYMQSGLVFGFALDSDQDQMNWGRIGIEACAPLGTEIRFWAFTRDDLDYADPIGGPPVGDNPPPLSQRMWDLRSGDGQTLYADPSQRPLSPAPADGFVLYDAPVMAPPGRYLWLVLELDGTRSKSPRVRAARIAFPGHGLLGQLPRTFWREPSARDFLFRYLSPIAAFLDEWGTVSDTRHRLLDARIAPGEALDWLAGFIGLVLDPCWPEAVKRRMILEAARLFRTRGTLTSLRRMIEILTDSEVVIIEQFRLRGGGVVGNPKANASQAVLGGGYRIGGMIGEVGSAPIDDAAPVDFDDFAHRFTVTAVAALSDAQLSCAARLIEYHKPAHTAFTLCSAQTGIRAGLGSNIGISSVIGKSGSFDKALVGDAVLGADYLLGRPALDAKMPGCSAPTGGPK